MLTDTSLRSHIYMYDITFTTVHAAAMKQEMFREVEAAQPELVLDVHDRISWSLGLAPEEQRIHEWLVKLNPDNGGIHLGRGISKFYLGDKLAPVKIGGRRRPLA